MEDRGPVKQSRIKIAEKWIIWEEQVRKISLDCLTAEGETYL